MMDDGGMAWDAAAGSVMRPMVAMRGHRCGAGRGYVAGAGGRYCSGTPGRSKVTVVCGRVDTKKRPLPCGNGTQHRIVLSMPLTAKSIRCGKPIDVKI